MIDQTYAYKHTHTRKYTLRNAKIYQYFIKATNDDDSYFI
jgi:hypothetical protein